MIALTKSGALEYGPTVRVNCVAPGHVRTPLTAVWEQMPDAFAPIAEAIPLGRIGEADEIAEVILFLASDRSSYITGQTLVVDGGVIAPAGRHRRRARQALRPPAASTRTRTTAAPDGRPFDVSSSDRCGQTASSSSRAPTSADGWRSFDIARASI